jgi:hypothetical protein
MEGWVGDGEGGAIFELQVGSTNKFFKKEPILFLSCVKRKQHKSLSGRKLISRNFIEWIDQRDRSTSQSTLQSKSPKSLHSTPGSLMSCKYLLRRYNFTNLWK